MVTARKPTKGRVRRELPSSVAKMSSKGQLTVPKAVREYFDLKPGDSVVFTRHEDGVLMQRYVSESPFAKWRGYLKDLKGEDVDRLIDEMRGR